MNAFFYISAVVAVISTIMVVTRVNAVHALLYFIVSLLSVGLIFFALGAPFAAALEVIVYAGAIMVLFVFVIMLLNLGKTAAESERRLLNSQLWMGPGVLALILFAELLYLLIHGPGGGPVMGVVGPKQVGISLLGQYVIGVELASLVLLAGLAGAYHLGRRRRPGADKGGRRW